MKRAINRFASILELVQSQLAAQQLEVLDLLASNSRDMLSRDELVFWTDLESTLRWKAERLCEELADLSSLLKENCYEGAITTDPQMDEKSDRNDHRFALLTDVEERSGC